MSGGIQGSIATFPVGGRESASGLAIAEITKQLGTVIDGLDGKAYRLVRLDLAAGVSSFPATAARSFIYTTRSSYDVKPCTALTDRAVGLSVGGQEALGDNDLFWVQIDGRFTGELGTGTAWASGDYVRCSGDTDTGKFERAATAGTTWAEGQTFAIAAAATTNDGDTALCDLVKRLGG